MSWQVAQQILTEALKGMDREVRENHHLPDMEIKSAKLAGYRYVQKVWSFWLNDVNVELKFPQGPGTPAPPPRRVTLRCKELELKAREGPTEEAAS